MWFIQSQDKKNNNMPYNRIVLSLDEAYALIKQLREDENVLVRCFQIHAEELVGIDAEFRAEYVSDGE